MKKDRITQYFRLNPYVLLVCAMIALSALLRIVLISQNYPLTNSDEGTMGLMALHIAYDGQFPAFLYGANYIGAVGSYLGAFLFHIFGPSLFSLRLGSVILFAAFQLALYGLISLLYTKRFALVSVSLLCLATPNMFSSQLRVTGGALETLLFGTLTLLLASYLALSYTDGPSGQKWRVMLYGCLGLVIGLGIWSYILIVPFVTIALLFLLLYCRRDLRLPIVLIWLAGLTIGLSPALFFDIFHPSQNLIQANLHVFGSGGTGILTKIAYVFWDQLRGTVLISIPMATGAWPICAVNSAPGAWRTEISSCMIPQGLWGCAFLLLWLAATVLAIWQAWRRARLAASKGASEDRREARRYAARLLLLGTAGLTMLAFLLSSAPALVPATAPRYLVGLEAAIPAVLWPLWQYVRFTKKSVFLSWRGKASRGGGSAPPAVVPANNAGEAEPLALLAVDVGEAEPLALLAVDVGGAEPPPLLHGLRRMAAIISAAALLCVAGVFMWGTINAFQQSAATAAVTQQQYQLIDELLRLKITRVYTDYWTCDRLAFLSDERIICSVLDNGLNPGVNRYAPYVALVRQFPHVTYVFGPDTVQVITLDRQLTEMHRHYRQIDINGYLVFQMT